MYVIHLDGDSFFASCELLRRPHLRGKPVVTGGERGVATSMSKEAKALGVTRGMPSFMIRKQFPEVTILSSDYDLYRMMAQRMYAIVRRHSDCVEEYSVDECFAYIDTRAVAYGIKRELEQELGVTYGVGVAQTKTLAKVASRYAKPAGIRFMCVSDEDVQQAVHEGVAEGDCCLWNTALQNMHIGGVWGIGRQTSMMLSAQGLLTAYDFAMLDQRYIESAFHKNVREKWHELRGTIVDSVGGSGSYFMTGYSKAHEQKSMCSSQTFETPTRDSAQLLTYIIEHVEEVCARARNVDMVASTCSFFLKRQDFSYVGDAVSVTSPTATPSVFVQHIRSALKNILARDPQKMLYRTAGCTLYELRPSSVQQHDLFGNHTAEDKASRVWAIADAINKRYGAHSKTPVVRPGSIGTQKKKILMHRAEGMSLPRFSFPHLGFVH